MISLLSRQSAACKVEDLPNFYAQRCSVQHPTQFGVVTYFTNNIFNFIDLVSGHVFIQKLFNMFIVQILTVPRSHVCCQRSLAHYLVIRECTIIEYMHGSSELGN